MSLPGRHVVLNAVAAIAAASEWGIGRGGGAECVSDFADAIDARGTDWVHEWICADQ